VAWVERRKTKRGATRYIVSWRDPETHKKARQSFRRDRDARAFKAQVEHELDRGTYVSRASSGEHFSRFLEQMLDSSWDLRASTLYQYRSYARRHVLPALGDLPLSQIRPEHIRRLVARMLEEGLGSGSISTVLQLVSKTFHQAIQEGRLVRNPMETIKAPARKRREVRLLEPAEVEQVAAQLERFACLAFVGAYAGLRLGEALALRTQDVDVSQRRIRVEATTVAHGGRPQGQRVYISEPKTRASRRQVAIPRFLAKELAAHMLQFPPVGGYLFTTKKEKLVDHTVFAKTFRLACQRAGLREPLPRFHDLRHTHAAWAIREGAHPKAIQERLGHSSIRVTMDIYGHLFPSLDKDLADRLDQLAEGSL